MPKTKIVKKSKHDKFYTKPKIAEWCLEILKPYVSEGWLLVEPSAGMGSFSSLTDCLAYDIEPDLDGIIKSDWFKVHLEQEQICVFGNPPFGERNDLSKRFIKHALSFRGTKIIAFILPRVYNKYTYQRVFPNNWSLVRNESLPDNSFLLNGIEYHVPCTFQIWIKEHKTNLRMIDTAILECRDFRVVKWQEHPDLFVFGSAPTKVILPNQVKETNRGFYLKLNCPLHEFMSIVTQIDWKAHGNSCVSGGAYWLTPTEFICIYEEFTNVK